MLAYIPTAKIVRQDAFELTYFQEEKGLSITSIISVGQSVRQYVFFSCWLSTTHSHSLKSSLARMEVASPTNRTILFAVFFTLALGC